MYSHFHKSQTQHCLSPPDQTASAETDHTTAPNKCFINFGLFIHLSRVTVAFHKRFKVFFKQTSVNILNRKLTWQNLERRRNIQRLNFVLKVFFLHCLEDQVLPYFQPLLERIVSSTFFKQVSASIIASSNISK